MKRCPNCQKEFADSMRFCQTDGTPLVEIAEKAPPPDPYKTVVGGQIKMDPDLLEIPEQDPMKTMVSPISMPKPDAPPPKPAGDPLPATPPKTESKPPESTPSAPKPSEPSLNAPSFGDLSPKSPSSNISSDLSSTSETPKSDPFSSKNEPPPSPFGSSPFSGDSVKNDSPFSKPPSSGTGSSPFDKPSNSPQQSSPFNKTPPPPYKDPEPMFGGQQPPQYNQSPFGQPQTPFGQSNEPANTPFQQNEWAPPPAPVAGWQDQGLGAETPFQPPVAGGQNNTLAIVSLVCGILSICLCGLLTGIPALITGYMAKNNADSNPAMYGGRGMALAGMITGGVGTLLGLLGIIYWVFMIASGGRF